MPITVRPAAYSPTAWKPCQLVLARHHAHGYFHPSIGRVAPDVTFVLCLPAISFACSQCCRYNSLWDAALSTACRRWRPRSFSSSLFLALVSLRLRAPKAQCSCIRTRHARLPRGHPIHYLWRYVWRQTVRPPLPLFRCLPAPMGARVSTSPI